VGSPTTTVFTFMCSDFFRLSITSPAGRYRHSPQELRARRSGARRGKWHWPGMDTGAGMWNAGGPGRSPCTTFIPGALAEAISFQTLLLSANPVTRISVHSANDLLT
jgi:hypothetical protein